MDNMEISGRYTATCLDASGKVKWSEGWDNLVTTQGRDHLLNHGLSGPADAVSARISLITSGTPVAGDTYATHAGFTELSNTVVSARGVPTFTASASGVRQTTAAVSYSVIGTGTITGSCVNLVVGTVGTLGTVGDTTTSGGILYSGGIFVSPKSVSNGDTLNVTYSTTLA